MRRLASGAAACLAALASGAIASAPGPAPTPAACAEQVRDRPGDLEPYLCFQKAARASGDWTTAVARLEALLALDAANPRARLALALIAVERSEPRAEALLRQASDDFRAARDALGEVRSRLVLAALYSTGARNDEAQQELDRAEAVAGEADDPVLGARVAVARARLAHQRADYGVALTLLEGVEKIATGSGSAPLLADWLAAKGSALWGMSRFPEAFDCFRQQADVLHQAGDLYEEAGARANVALLYAAGLRGRELTPDEKAEQRRLVEQALEVAQRGGNRTIEGKSLIYLAQLATEPPEYRRRLRDALALGPALRPDDRLLALRLLAESLVYREPSDPAAAWLLLDQAVAEAQQRGDLQGVARARVVRATIPTKQVFEAGWTPERHERLLAEYPAAMDAVEAIRDRQADGEVRARTFSQWVFLYRRVAGTLLWPPESTPDPADVERAFAVMERMRARVLLDELDAAAATGALRGGRSAAPLAHDAASLGEVQRALAPDEALLSFQLADRGALRSFYWGGSWLIVVTRQAVAVHPLPDRAALEAPVRLFLGLVAKRDGSEAEGAARLFADLLAPAVAGLPAGVGRLVIAPDDLLLRVPFEMLRPDAAGEPLGIRFAVTIVPSATTWLRQRSLAGPTAPGRALVFVDPELVEAEEPGRADGSPPAERSAPARLAFAREEARALRRELGGDCEILAAADASERALESAPLEQFGIVHFAAHAVADPQRPDRSAVLLAPGSPDDDGRLEAREIVALDFTGRVVVLSACHGAAGPGVRGGGADEPGASILRVGRPGGRRQPVAPARRRGRRALRAVLRPARPGAQPVRGAARGPAGARRGGRAG